MVTDGFDFSPGAQVPLSGAAGQTAATQALASAAYRDDPVAKLLDANSEWTVSEVKKPRISLFEPNLGEAFARAVQMRMLGGGRGQVIQSFGMEPQTVVEHCLAANRIRKTRDARLTAVMVIFGLLFLPGTLLWLGVFQLRRSVAGAQDKRMGALGTALLVALGVMVVIFLIKLPFGGFWGIYLRGVVVAPVIGWYIAKQICERTAKDLRDSWGGLLSGGGVGAKVPETVPNHPGQTAAEELRKSLHKLTAEQYSNVVFYAGPKGILGMGTRWGSWQLAEDLVSADPDKEIDPFRSWDVIRAIHDQLRMLERTPLHTGGFPTPSVRHWVVSPIGEGAKAVERGGTSEEEGFQIKGVELQRICDQQQFGAGDRHYLGVQFVLWDGQLVITLMITVTLLHKTLRIEVTGHALGPVHPLFTSKPSAPSKTVAKTFRFWETKSIPLPLVNAKEVVRLTARAPFTWYPPILDHLGGKLVLPEPFGLRHAWADKPWRHRFMADDALRAATPVLRVVHEAAIGVLKNHGVDTERFGNRSLALSGQVQDVAPKKADLYDA
ncbi:membrane protein [Streptomyces rapamycinicus NRRL 5491]|nr:membrane protein [Streptomyces rapamycinicus NRRL 5491]